MSNENEEKLQNYINAKEPAFGVVRSMDGMRRYGGRGYPTFVLLDGQGQIVQYGMPSRSAIEAALRTVDLMPEMPADRHFDSVKRYWKDQNFRRVADWLEKERQNDSLSETQKAAVGSLSETFNAQLRNQLSRIERLKQGPDYLKAEEQIEQIQKDYRGLKVADVAKKALKQLADDDTVQAEIKSMKKLDRLLKRFDASKYSQRKKLRLALTDFVQRYSGTYAAKKAKGQLAQLR